MSEFDKTPLYLQIAESIRQEVAYGAFNAGDQLPPLRDMADRWRCTVGTVQRAYAELAREGLVTTRSGQGTRVASPIHTANGNRAALRRATLANQVERFLLEALAAGYQASEVEQTLHMALDRWHAIGQPPPEGGRQAFRFSGSHDPSITLVAARIGAIAPGASLRVSFEGSLGGLIAIARGEADLAGCHLWDEHTDSYNVPFAERILPGRQVVLLTLAHRRLGFLTPAGNPAGLGHLSDLARPGVRFVNRQRGAGTRVWLDAQLHRLGILADRLAGYADEALTHSDVARAVADGRADVGLGIEAAAIAYGLAFVPLTTERYDLAMLPEIWQSGPIQALARWLGSGEAQQEIAALGGYDVGQTGKVQWVG